MLENKQQSIKLKDIKRKIHELDKKFDDLMKYDSTYGDIFTENALIGLSFCFFKMHNKNNFDMKLVSERISISQEKEKLKAEYKNLKNPIKKEF
jgi:hypothetical protein